VRLCVFVFDCACMVSSVFLYVCAFTSLCLGLFFCACVCFRIHVYAFLCL